MIYVGTFSKVLFPGLRLAYMVIPPALIDAFTIGNTELYREGRLGEQAALAGFIENGHFATHIRRMRSIYQERLETLRELLERELGGAITCLGGHAGLHLPVRLDAAVDETAISQRWRCAKALYACPYRVTQAPPKPANPAWCSASLQSPRKTFVARPRCSCG